MDYEPVIGLEIHAELNTSSKMFCRCKNDPFCKQPNTFVCPVCLGMPGSLPVMNKKAIEWTVMAGLALNCKIAEFSKWDRKNYFYPDLPKGYQISQYDLPLSDKGYLEIDGKKVGITRIHLEEDTGKLMHPAGTNYSLVDYNRAGVPLLELVTEPDIRSGNEAKQFAQELQLIFRTLGISRADMEKGEMRVEVNISLRKKGEEKFGTKVEVKNLNSFRAVERSVGYEIERQTELLSNGDKVIHETRGWNEDKGRSFSQREKETAQDYRYFPEPDLPPVEVSGEWKDSIIKQMPTLPAAKRQEYREKYNLPEDAISVLAAQPKLGNYFDRAMEASPDTLAVLMANWLVHELVNLDIKPQDFASLMSLIDQRAISGTMGKEVLKEMGKTGKGPERVVEEKGLKQITGEAEIRDIAVKIIDNNPQALADYKKGKGAAIGYLVGQLMKETRGQAEPQLAQKLIKEILEEEK